MTERLADISAHVRSVGQLGSVISAMRGIAASRAQQSRTALAGVQAYSGLIGAAITAALRLQPPEATLAGAAPRTRLLILFVPEQGFVGNLADRMLDAVAADRAELFVIGSRGAMLAEARGLAIAWHTEQAAHPDGIADVASQIAAALFNMIERGAAEVVDLVLPVTTGQEVIAVERRSLVPLDLSRFAAVSNREPPLTTLQTADLLVGLTEEYLFAQLCEAAMLAFLAENEARVVAMASAKRNVERMLSDLQAREREVRQAEITAEVVELAAGSSLFQDAARRSD